METMNIIWGELLRGQKTNNWDNDGRIELCVTKVG